MHALAKLLTRHLLTIREATMAQQNINSIVHHLQGVRDNLQGIQDQDGVLLIPVAGGDGGLQ